MILKHTALACTIDGRCVWTVQRPPPVSCPRSDPALTLCGTLSLCLQKTFAHSQLSQQQKCSAKTHILPEQSPSASTKHQWPPTKTQTGPKKFLLNVYPYCLTDFKSNGCFFANIKLL
jgi:hypothetical protein